MDTIVVKRKLDSLREHVMLIEENTPDNAGQELIGQACWGKEVVAYV